SARTPSRVTIPWRSSRSSASARRSLSPAKSRSVSDQRPWVAVIAVARRREKRRGLRSGLGTPYLRPARSGVQASFVTSPAQTSSHSAGSRSAASISRTRHQLTRCDPDHVDEVEPELSAPPERLPNPVMDLPLGTIGAVGTTQDGGVLAEEDRA